jgi:phenylacetate-CoA ligase
MIDEYFEVARLLSGRLPSADGLEAIRQRRLKALLDYAYRHVPYYRDLFDGVGLAPADIRSVGDLRRLPVSSRERLRSAGRDRCSGLVDPAACKTLYSSGSTGQPWPVYRSLADDRLRRAVELRSMIAAGIRPRDRVATLGPVVRAGVKQTLGRLGIFRTSFVSPLLPIEEQAARLRALRPDVFWVYPTALRALLQHVGCLSEIMTPRLLVTSAEPLDDLTRRRLLADRAFELRNFYGSVEVGRVAFDCAAGEGLHINADCSILELEEGGGVPGAGGAVVITNLNSRASPYIRFRLGDLCEFIERPCSCGSPLPLMKAPVGREWDVIQLPGGELMSPWAFNSILRNVEGLLQFRVIQKRIDLLLLQLQFEAPPTAGLLESLGERLQRSTGESLTLRIETVEGFANEALKFRAFLSELDDPRAPPAVTQGSPVGPMGQF